MAEMTWDRIRKIQILLFIVVIVMLLFGGCGGEETENGEARLEDMRIPISGGVNISALGTSEWKESQAVETEGMTEAAPEMEINPDTARVTCQGTAFMSSSRAIGGDSIYSTGFLGAYDGNYSADEAYFAGRIGIEEDEIQQCDLEIPGDLFAIRGCVDRQGKWHLLLVQKTEGFGAGGTVEILEDGRMEIWVINRDGEQEQSIDVTESFRSGGSLPTWMDVDQQGNYYFAAGQSIMILNTGQQSVEMLNFGGDIDGMGIGRSGALYGVFDAGEGDFLGLVDIEGGSIRKCAAFPENDTRPSFSVLQEGVGTEILLANKGDGIWSYDGEELKQVRLLDDMAANGQDILAMGFLWDGRVCVMSYEGEEYVFHYAPVEM